MLLHKFCERKFNIALDCNTLRLGTLQEYREMDPSFSIADQWEGISQAGTNGNFITFKGEELIKSGLSIPAISLGPNAGGATINIKGGMTMTFPNVYIFCLSLNETNSSLKEYDSKYIISDPQLFSIELLRLFTNQLKINDFEESVFLYSEISQMNIQCFHGPVKYLEKPFTYTMENRMKILKNFNDTINSYFTKSVDKIEDKEYRFVMIPMIGQRIISVKKEPKILNIKPFNGVVGI